MLYKKLLKTFSTSAKPPQRTFLYDYHVNQLKAKMVEFAGYDMPVNYKDGVLKEHLFCRESAGFFDVSHMGQVKIRGKARFDFIEKVVVGDISGLNTNGSALSLILNDNAGIIDDTIVTKLDDHIHMVVNAGNKYKDLDHMKIIQAKYFQDKDLSIEYIEDRSLIALQGPKASEILQTLLKDQIDFKKVPFMTHLDFSKTKIAGFDLMISRSGYTGEDGFEISVANNQTIEFVDLLFKDPRVKPVGLGARDSLRLEAGLCLHGNDIDENINPAEAGLMWTVRKKNFNFIGGETLEAVKKKGVDKKRVGFTVEANAGTARHGVEVLKNGNKIGIVTSGTYSPILKTGIGMAYLNKDETKNGNIVKGSVRGKEMALKLCKMPFVPSKYHKI